MKKIMKGVSTTKEQTVDTTILINGLKKYWMYSKAICWIDDCRIPFVDDIWIAPKKPRSNLGIKLSKGNEERNEANTQGRFPANILVSDDMLNDGNITKNGDIKPHKQKRKTLVFNSNEVISTFKSDKGTNSRYYDIDKWFDKILND